MLPGRFYSIFGSTAAPIFTSMFPQFAPITAPAGGWSCTIKGTNLPISPTVTCKGVAATVTSTTSTTLTFTTGNGTVGVGDVVVNGGTAFASAFYYLAGMVTAWLADDAPNNGTIINASWLDRISSKAMVPAGSPQWIPNANLGRAYARFDGISQIVQCSTMTWSLGYRAFLAMNQKAYNASGNNYFLGGIPGAGYTAVGQKNTSPEISMYAGASGCTNNNLPLNTYATIGALNNGATSSIWVNGTNITGNDGGQVTDHVGIGGLADGGSGGFFTQIDAGALLFFDTTASGYSDTNTEAAIATAYGGSLNTFPLSGVLFDWVADDALTATWFDRVAGKVLGASGTNFDIHTSVLGTHSGVRFNGTSQGALSATTIVRANPTEVWTVAKIITWTNNNCIWSVTGGSDAVAMGGNGTTPHLGIYAGGAWAGTVSGLTIGSYSIVRAVVNGASSSIGIDANCTSPTTANGGPNPFGGTFYLGEYNSNSYLNCEIAEVLIVDPSASGYSAATLLSALKTRYGL